MSNLPKSYDAWRVGDPYPTRTRYVTVKVRVTIEEEVELEVTADSDPEAEALDLLKEEYLSKDATFEVVV